MQEDLFKVDDKGIAHLELDGQQYQIRKMGAIEGSFVLANYGRADDEKTYALVQRKLLGVCSRVSAEGFITPIMMTDGERAGQITIPDLANNTKVIVVLATASLVHNLGPTMAAMRPSGEIATILSHLNPLAIQA